MHLPSILITAAVVTALTVSAERSRELLPYTPEGGRCTFSTVGGRKPVTVAYQRGEGADAAVGKLYCFDQPNCRCQVRYVDLPSSAVDLSRTEIVRRYGFETWSREGQLERLGTVKSGEHEGDAYAVAGLRGAVRVRVFVAAKHAFFVSASFSRETEREAEPEAKAFFESFRIVSE